MRKIIILIILLWLNKSYAQEPAPGKVNKDIAFRQISPEKRFENDLADNELRVYVMGGIAAVITMGDRDIAQKNNFVFHDFGCLAPDLVYYKAYNKYVIAYLNKKYGTEWQKDIRKNLNIIGRDLLLAEK